MGEEILTKPSDQSKNQCDRVERDKKHNNFGWRSTNLWPAMTRPASISRGVPLGLPTLGGFLERRLIWCSALPLPPDRAASDCSVGFPSICLSTVSARAGFFL